MDYAITLKNYRCFPLDKPARFEFSTGGATAFIGPNNAGKSAPLRFLFEFRNLLAQMADTEALIETLRGAPRSSSLNEVSDQTEIFCDANDKPLVFELAVLEAETAKSGVRVIDRMQITVSRDDSSWVTTGLFANGVPIKPDTEGALAWNGHVASDSRGAYDFAPIIQAAEKLRTTLYLGSTRNALNVGSDRKYFDIDVGSGFVEKFKSWKSGENKAHNLAIITLRDQIREIFGFDDLEISPSSDARTLQLNIDGSSRRIDEVGAGIAQVVISLTHAMISRPTFVLIDEPELSLHPALQTQFLDVLRSYATEGVLFSTHSIGLARTTATRIYSVRQSDYELGTSEMHDFVDEPNLGLLLGEMEFTAHREVGFTTVLLVEGPSDADVTREILRKMRADHEVMVVPLGGSSLINGISEMQLSEFQRITPTVAALVDSERAGPDEPLQKERQGFLDVCTKLGIPAHATERRAIENYLSEKAIKRVKGDMYESLGPYQRLKDLPIRWGKAEDWRIIRAMSLDEILATDVGQFLKKVVEMDDAE